MFRKPFKTQGGGLGGGKGRADPQKKAEGFLPKQAEQRERAVRTAACAPRGR